MRVRSFVFAVVAAFLFVGFVSAQEASVISPALRAKVDASVEAFQKKTLAPGVSIALVKDGKLVYARGYGLANLEQQVAATAETRYRLASVSKTITAIAAMQLVEAGKLELDVPVQRYCPAFPVKQATITTRMLLGNISGIRHYREGEAGLPEVNNTRHFADPIAGGLSFFKDDGLIDEPGKHFHYTTHGFTVVGCVIEGASGEKYGEYVRAHVLEPAKMEATVTDDRFAIVPNRTNFYSKSAAGKIENAEFLDDSYKVPGGGWLASATDLARYEIAVMDGKLVKPATLELMGTALKPTDGSESEYGLGFFVGHVEAGGKKLHTISHSGGQQGTSTNILLAPTEKTAVVALVNLDGAPASDLARELAQLLLKEK